MQLPNQIKFDSKKIEQILLKENKLILNLLKMCGVPERKNLDEEDQNDNKSNVQTHSFMKNNADKKPRAKSLQELEERLKAITSKKKLTYKEKLAKKGLKNRMKKKNKQDERNAKSKLERAGKLTMKNENVDNNNQESHAVEDASIIKPVFNKDNKMVFSRIDFDNMGKKKKNKKQEKNPEKILEKLKEQTQELQELEKSGETTKVVEIKEKTAWKNALAKSEGLKVKDDPILLKKSVNKKEQKVRASKKKWENRIQGVEKSKEERQKKRTENIESRKKGKKVKKLKNAVKRGKIIPGF